MHGARTNPSPLPDRPSTKVDIVSLLRRIHSLCRPASPIVRSRASSIIPHPSSQMTRPIQATIRTRDDEPGGGAVTAAEFREAVAQWASGVAVLAARDEDEVEAITLTAFAPLSATPPLVLACVGNDAAVLYVLEDAGRFTVNLLAADDRRAASAFAQRMPIEPARFEDGDPVLKGALVSLVCRVAETHAGGDHRIVVGQVERVVTGDAADPLLYYHREYRALSDGR
jgi:flavin reductase (NADH)